MGFRRLVRKHVFPILEAECKHLGHVLQMHTSFFNDQEIEFTIDNGISVIVTKNLNGSVTIHISHSMVQFNGDPFTSLLFENVRENLYVKTIENNIEDELLETIRRLCNLDTRFTSHAIVTRWDSFFLCTNVSKLEDGIYTLTSSFEGNKHPRAATRYRSTKVEFDLKDELFETVQQHCRAYDFGYTYEVNLGYLRISPVVEMLIDMDVQWGICGMIHGHSASLYFSFPTQEERLMFKMAM